MVHPVLSGTSVPLGENSCEVRTALLDTVQHGSTRHILEGRFEIKSNKDSGGVSLRKVFNGLDLSCLHHLVFPLRTAKVSHFWPLIPSLLPLLI